MDKIKRTTFLKQGLKIGGAVLLAPYIGLAANARPEKMRVQEDMMARLVAANDKQVEKLLTDLRAGITATGRKIGFDFATLSASYVSPVSAYYQSPLVVAALEKLIQLLKGLQSADGTLNFSGDVVLSLSGQYRLTVNAGANLSLDAIATGTLFTEATSAYTISGKITENASTGGGKKK